VRSARSREARTSPDDGLIALASDLSTEELGKPGVPVFNLDDIEGIADFLLQHFSITPLVEGA
jgi:hypothetical protein